MGVELGGLRDDILQELSRANEFLIEGGKEMLSEAAAENTKQCLSKALNCIMRSPFAASLKETPEFANALSAYKECVEIPTYFDDGQVLATIAGEAVETLRNEVESQELLDAFQDLFDMTHSKVRTRDRRGTVPNRLVVKEVNIIQNTSNFLDYKRRREKIRALSQQNGIRIPLGDLAKSNVCKTFKPLPKCSDMQFHEIWKKVRGAALEPIDPSINEFYLFHGTSPAAARGITDGDFRIDLAGSNAGTLYGKGCIFVRLLRKAMSMQVSTNEG